MIGDVQHILHGSSEGSSRETPKINSLTNIPSKKSTPKLNTINAAKKYGGVSRELMNLVSPGELPSIMPTDMRKSYVNPKLKTSFRAVRKFKWVPFTNEGRSDGLQLFHWQRIDRIDGTKPYPFAAFNKVIEIPSYTDEEYENHLKCSKWSREETDYLFEVCRRFDIRWPVVYDRFDKEKYGVQRSMEDLKDRFYAIVHELSILKDPNATPIAYDAEHEKRRKEQLVKQWDRTKEQLQEEEDLTAELRRIEMRKKEREKKAHDLQKLINMTDQPASPSTSSSAGNVAISKRKSVFRTKVGSVSTATASSFNPMDISVSTLRFSEFKSSGAHLRSQEMKLPTNIGQKKLKNIEIVLEKCKMEMNPVGSESIMKIYNEFRSQIMLLIELKSALQTTEFELESLRTRLHENGKPCEIEPRMRVSNLVDGGLHESAVGGEGNAATARRITSYIDVNQKDLAANASRKRKAPAVMTPSSIDLKRVRKM